MTDVDLGDDDGYLNLTVDGVIVRLDVWDVNNKIVEAHKKNKDKPDGEYGEAMAALFVGLGFPALSRRMLERAVKTIGSRAEELAKN